GRRGRSRRRRPCRRVAPRARSGRPRPRCGPGGTRRAVPCRLLPLLGRRGAGLVHRATRAGDPVGCHAGSVPELTWIAWVALAVGAVTVGISKTAIPGANIAVALFAMVLPAKPSTAALLVLLIVADVFAVVFYRRFADWRVLRRLVPPVVVGLVAGAVFMSRASDALMARVIGVILIAVIVLGLVQRHRAQRREAAGGGDRVPQGRGAAVAQRAFYGSLGGFTTMVANAAGPIMSMYFLAVRLPVTVFLGTSAWFYFVINLSK